MSTRSQLTANMQWTNQMGQLTPAAWFWLNQLQIQQPPSGSGYILNGDYSQFPDLTISEGPDADKGTAIDGNVYFATDTGIIYVGVESIWSALIPLFTGDVSNGNHTTNLTLATVNLNPGTYTNANIVVNSKGLVTFASNGSGSVSAAGSQWDIQFNDGGVLGATNDLNYNASTQTLNIPGTLNFAGDGTIYAPDGPITIQSDTTSTVQGNKVVIDATGDEVGITGQSVNSTSTYGTTITAGNNLTLASSNTTTFRLNGGATAITFNPYGAIGIGSSSNYGTAGQYLVSQGSSSPVAWANATISQIPFNYGDSTPELITTLPANSVVKQVDIIILTAFNGVGAALSVGSSAGSYIDLLNTSMVAPSLVGTWSNEPGLQYTSSTQVFIQITAGTGASQGKGYVVLTLA